MAARSRAQDARGTRVKCTSPAKGRTRAPSSSSDAPSMESVRPRGPPADGAMPATGSGAAGGADASIEKGSGGGGGARLEKLTQPGIGARCWPAPAPIQQLAPTPQPAG
jgi:hypothetical protein